MKASDATGALSFVSPNTVDVTNVLFDHQTTTEQVSNLATFSCAIAEGGYLGDRHGLTNRCSLVTQLPSRQKAIMNSQVAVVEKLIILSLKHNQNFFFRCSFSKLHFLNNRSMFIKMIFSTLFLIMQIKQ